MNKDDRLENQIHKRPRALNQCWLGVVRTVIVCTSFIDGVYPIVHSAPLNYR